MQPSDLRFRNLWVREEMSGNIEIKLPESISNWVFDLHDATRRSMRSEEVSGLYEVEYKELTDKYFSQSAWPLSKVVAPECNHDEQFLIFYNELRTRHIFTSLKTQLADLTLADFTESWNNYIAIFDFLLGSPNPDIALTTQWVHDIIVEFIYQFQGFCQYRCQVRSRTEEEIQVLDSNRDVWVLPRVMSILNRLASPPTSTPKRLSTVEQFGYFAAVEKIRLECLLGDYGSALETCSLIKLGDRSEPYFELPSCHVNLYYHVGVCQMMLRKYDEAIDTFVEISLHVSRVIRLGNSATLKNGLEVLMKKMLDKMLALTAVCVTLSPGVRLDDQVRELMESKYMDRIRRMQMGNIAIFGDLFECSCPKFISSAIPDYKVQSNLCTEVFQNQVANFSREVQQRVGALKLRSYLRLYASIDLEKLARFSEMSSESLTSQVLSYKLKVLQEQGPDGVAKNAGVHYYVKDGSLVIDSTPGHVDRSNAAERFLFTGMRKNAEILRDVEKSYQNILM